MTEEEAKTKWCPFVRAHFTINRGPTGTKDDPVVGFGSGNRSSSGRADSEVVCCIGSACMAWRKGLTPLKGYQNTDGTSVVTEWGDSEGYCGLSGKP